MNFLLELVQLMYVVALDEVLVMLADTAVYVNAVVPPKVSASTHFVPPKSKIPKMLVIVTSNS